MLTAKAMGYDSCLMIGFDPPNVAELSTSRAAT
jgi:nitroreductase